MTEYFVSLNSVYIVLPNRTDEICLERVYRRVFLILKQSQHHSGRSNVTISTHKTYWFSWRQENETRKKIQWFKKKKKPTNWIYVLLLFKFQFRTLSNRNVRSIDFVHLRLVCLTRMYNSYERKNSVGKKIKKPFFETQKISYAMFPYIFRLHVLFNALIEIDILDSRRVVRRVLLN